MKKTSNRFGWLVVLLAGVVFLAIAVVLYSSASKTKTGYGKTEATIEKITQTQNSSGNGYSYEVYITYEVDGTKYENTLNYYSSSMNKGDSIEIYYNLINPNSIEYSKGDYMGSYITGGVGVICLVIGGCMLGSDIKKKSRAKLVKTGNKIQGTIEAVDVNMNTTMNGRHPYSLTVKGTDGKEYVQKSIYDNLSFLKKGDQISVCLDKVKGDKYYIDYKDNMKTGDSINNEYINQTSDDDGDIKSESEGNNSSR